MRAIDVFVDVSNVPDALLQRAVMARVEDPDRLGAVSARLASFPPRGLAAPATAGVRRTRLATGAVRAFGAAVTAAVDSGRPLLVLLGDVDPGCEAVGMLRQALDEDPMIGFAVPRFRGSSDRGVAVLDGGGDRGLADLPRRVLAEIQDTYLVADAPGRCVLIKPEVLANFEGVDERFRSVAGALWHYVGRARRCGFRTVVCNRAVVPALVADQSRSSTTIALGALPEADRMLLRELLPETNRALEEFGTAVFGAAETRLARAMPTAYPTRPSLLLDVRNIGAEMNGTAMAALGVARGLQLLNATWEIALVARREACALHRLESSFPDWPVCTRLPDRQFTVALRLSQPWHVDEMIELHKLAAHNVYLFLDTIAWDTAYPAPRNLDGTWRFLADHADGFLFISDFTRQRFRRRFPSSEARPNIVCHLSFEPADYVLPGVVRPSDPDGPIFVIGNAYDHKDVAQTLDVLTRAFPYQPFVALGTATASNPQVTVFESGSFSEFDLHRLYAGARAVVFPSLYEGFGFPAVTTLAYGQTLLARRSPLVQEIAAQCPPGGRLVTFARRDELVELVGRLLHGQRVPEEALGTAIAGRRPKSWRDVASDIVTFLTDISADVSRSRWRSREHAIRQVIAARDDAVAL
jgi:glycosyltransferase involved in cell wall biosynthesis